MKQRIRNLDINNLSLHIARIPKEATCLDLSNNNIGSAIKDNKTEILLENALSNIPVNIESIRLCANNLGNMTSNNLKNVLSWIPDHVRFLDLSCNNLNGKENKEIKGIFAQIPYVNSLDLSATGLDQDLLHNYLENRETMDILIDDSIIHLEMDAEKQEQKINVTPISNMNYFKLKNNSDILEFKLFKNIENQDKLIAFLDEVDLLLLEYPYHKFDFDLYPTDPSYENRLKYVNKACELLIKLSQSTPSEGDLLVIEKDLKALKENAATSTTFGRVLFGLLTALIIPLVAILETLALPILACLGKPYEGTAWLAKNTHTMFSSQVPTSIKLVEEFLKDSAQTIPTLNPDTTDSDIIAIF